MTRACFVSCPTLGNSSKRDDGDSARSRSWMECCLMRLSAFMVTVSHPKHAVTKANSTTGPAQSPPALDHPNGRPGQRVILPPTSLRTRRPQSDLPIRREADGEAPTLREGTCLTPSLGHCPIRDMRQGRQLSEADPHRPLNSQLRWLGWGARPACLGSTANPPPRYLRADRAAQAMDQVQPRARRSQRQGSHLAPCLRGADPWCRPAAGNRFGGIAQPAVGRGSKRPVAHHREQHDQRLPLHPRGDRQTPRNNQGGLTGPGRGAPRVEVAEIDLVAILGGLLSAADPRQQL